MPFSFNPGQSGQVANPSGGEAPPLIVPTAPVITTTAPPEVISPFAYKNRNKSSFGVYFQFAVFLIFGITVIVSLGLFAYQRVLIAQIESKKQTLAEKEKAFPKLELDKMQDLSDRIKIINKVLSERASVKTAFSLLEATILDNTVTYNKFSLSKNKRGKGFSLSFGGETTSYTTLYQQIAALNDKRFAEYFSKINISGIGPLDKKGVGTFKADTVIYIEGINPDTFTIGKPTDSTTSAGQQDGTNQQVATSTDTIPILQ